VKELVVMGLVNELGDRKGSYYKRTKMDSEEGTG